MWCIFGCRVWGGCKKLLVRPVCRRRLEFTWLSESRVECRLKLLDGVTVLDVGRQCLALMQFLGRRFLVTV